MKSVSISVNFETGDIMHSFDDGPDCDLHCQALWKSIKHDWPGYVGVVVSDAEAEEARANRLLRFFGIDPDNSSEEEKP